VGSRRGEHEGLTPVTIIQDRREPEGEPVECEIVMVTPESHDRARTATEPLCPMCGRGPERRRADMASEALATAASSGGGEGDDPRASRITKLAAALLDCLSDSTVGSSEGFKPEMWMTTAEAAQYAGVPEATIRTWVRGGKIEHGRDGRSIRLRASAIDAYLLARNGAKANRRRQPAQNARLDALRRELEKGTGCGDG